MPSLHFLALLLLFWSPSWLQARETTQKSGDSQFPNANLKKMLDARSPKFTYDKRMIQAAEIAGARAARSPQYHYWRHVKQALLRAHVIDSYPKTLLAKQAAGELQSSFGFQRLPLTNPYQAPKGSVLVYGGLEPGHVEIRSETGFVSDFASLKPSGLPLIGIYVKPRH